MVDINSGIEYKKRGTKPQKCRFPLQIQGKLAFQKVQDIAPNGEGYFTKW